MNPKGAPVTLTRTGLIDTVFCPEGKTCLRVRNHGEMLVLQANLDVSDEQLIETFATYLKWRRGHPPPEETL
jgi:hypothetical protein